MLRSRGFHNEYCSTSKQRQNITVYFEVNDSNNINNFKRIKFDCNNAKCNLRNTKDCPIFNGSCP